MQRFLWRMLVFVTLATGSSFATNGGTELEALQRRYEAALDSIATERVTRFQGLQSSYLKALEELRQSQVARGDLESVLVIKAKQDRVNTWQELAADEKAKMPAVLARLRRQYDANYQRIIAEQQQKEVPTRQGYLRELDALQRRYTQADRIPDALAVKKVRDQVAAGLPVVAEGAGVVRQPVEWVAVPFPANSDWPGPRGAPTKIADGQLVINGQRARATRKLQLPVTIEFEYMLEARDRPDGALHLELIPVGVPVEDQSEQAVSLSIGYARPTGPSQLTVGHRQQLRDGRTLWNRQADLPRAGEWIRVRWQLDRLSSRLTVGDETKTLDEVPFRFAEFQMEFFGWQPLNIWRVRNIVIR